MIELFGTAASVIVALSLTMRNLKWLRVLNAVGAAAFAAYGALIGALPVLLLNAFIVGIDLYYLARLRLTRDAFSLLSLDPTLSPYVGLFLDFHRAEIQRFQPDFRAGPEEGWRYEFVLRDLLPVALVAHRPRGEAEVEIGLDYAVPSHRDFKSAEFYFRKAAEGIARGRELVFVAWSGVPAHSRYLERLGFEAAGGEGSGPREYRKRIRG